MRSRAAGAAVLALGSLVTSAAFASGGQINVTPSSITFAETCVGTTSGPEAVKIENVDEDAGDTLDVSSISLGGSNPGDFTKAHTATPFTLDGNFDSETVTVRFKPVGRGTRSATLEIGYDEGNGSETTTVTLSGTGRDRRIATDRATVAFGEQRVGSRSPAQKLLIRNPGEDSLTVTGLTRTGANAGEFRVTASPAPFVIAAGQVRELTFAFQPAGAGLRNGALQIASTACGQPSISVSLVGTGVVPNISIAPNPVDVGMAPSGTEGPATAVTIFNDGGAPLKVSGVQVVGANAADFALSGLPLFPVTIQQGESFVFSVRMTASATGPRQATINVLSDDPETPTLAVPLRGVAGTPSPSPSPNSPTPSPTATAPQSPGNKPQAATPAKPNDTLAIWLVVLLVAGAFAGLVVIRKTRGTRDEDEL